VPGDNFSRRVARAAASGGGRTYRAQTPVSWYLVLLAICLLGVSLVAYSRYELLHPLPAATKASVPPTASDEWQAAVAVDICGTFVPTALPVDKLATDPLASIGDGIVRIEPSLSPQPTAYEGKAAILGAYLQIEGASVSAALLSVPGKPVPVPTTTTTTSTTTTTTVPKGKKATTTTSTSSSTTTTSSSTTTSTTAAKSKGKSTTTTSSSTTSTTVATEPGPAKNYKNGVTKCGSKPGYISVETWPKTTSTKGTIVPVAKADGTLLENGQMITIAFLPKGSTIPQPPAVDRAALKSFAIEDPGGIATTTIPSTVATTSTSSTSTSSTSSTTSTTAPKSTTTSSSSSTTSST
jgi:hypothetical protein